MPILGLIIFLVGVIWLCVIFPVLIPVILVLLGIMIAGAQ